MPRTAWWYKAVLPTRPQGGFHLAGEMERITLLSSLMDLPENRARKLIAKISLIKRGAEKAGEDLTDYPNLHQVRIAGKRLRYAMEVFACCFGPAFRVEVYPAVEEMQEILGRANDQYVASERLKEIREHLRSAWPDVWSRVEAGVDAALHHHLKSLPTERRRFLRWWKKWQAEGAPQLE